MLSLGLLGVNGEDVVRISGTKFLDYHNDSPAFEGELCERSVISTDTVHCHIWYSLASYPPVFMHISTRTAKENVE